MIVYSMIPSSGSRPMQVEYYRVQLGAGERSLSVATKIYVGNLSYETTEDQLRAVFADVGEVDSVTLITDRHSGRSKGFAFVEMSNDEEAKTAITQLNGKEIDGRTMNVSEARPREDRRPSSGFSRSGGYGGGRGRSTGGRQSRPTRF